MKNDDLPPAVKKHPELARLLQLTEGNPEAQKALMEFFRACELLPRAELAEVLACGERWLRGGGEGRSI